MTGDELAAALYAEQGYLVVGSIGPCEIGEVNDGAGTQSASAHATIPLRVVAESNLEEYLRQRKLVAKLTGRKAAGKGYTGLPHYYRVEAAD